MSSKMIIIHRNMILGDQDADYIKDLKDLKQDKEKKVFIDENGKLIYNYEDIYLYEHGNIVISNNPFNCKWDSYRAGIIYSATDSHDKLIDRINEYNIYLNS